MKRPVNVGPLFCSIPLLNEMVDSAYDGLRTTPWAGVQGDPSLQLPEVVPAAPVGVGPVGPAPAAGD